MEAQTLPGAAPAALLPSSKKRKRKSGVYSADALGKMKKGRLVSLVLSLQEELQQLKNDAKGVKVPAASEAKEPDPKAAKAEDDIKTDQLRLARKKLVEKIIKVISSTSMTTATNTMFRPYVNVETEMAMDIAMTLIGELGEEKKNSNRYLVRNLNQSELNLLLPDLPEQCDVMYSAEASLMTTATIDTLEFKYDKKNKRLKLRIRIARARGAGIFSTAELFDDAAPEEGEDETKEEEDTEAKTST